MGAKPQARGSPKQKTKKAAKAKTQKERFIEAARSIGVDETGKEFERLFKKIAPPK
jgi:hypothetical protein